MKGRWCAAHGITLLFVAGRRDEEKPIAPKPTMSAPTIKLKIRTVKSAVCDIEIATDKTVRH